MQNGDVSPQLSYAASRSPGSSLKYVRKTPDAVKRSWPGATPLALGTVALMKRSQWASSVRPSLQVVSPLLQHSMSTPFLFKLSPSLFCFPLQDSGADPASNVQRGTSRQSLVHGGLEEPERKDTSPQIREVYAQGLLHERRKLATSPTVPILVYAGQSWFQGVDEGRTARTVTRSMLKKARIRMTN